MKGSFFRFIVLVSITFFLIIAANPKQKKIKTEVRKKIMKVAMVIAKDGFRDEEYFQPKEVLTKAGILVDTYSSSTGTAVGMLGAKVKVDKKIDEIKIEDYDAVVFVGGIGSSEYWDNSTAHKIVQEAIKQNKIIAAICIAPITLAKAGILKDKKATVFSSEVEQLKKFGANYTAKDVEVDGKIITASGPHVAKQFGEKIKELLLK